MIDHMSTYTVNFETSQLFYQEVFLTLGYEMQSNFVAEWNQDFPTQRMCAFGPEGQSIFWLIELKEESTPRHFAFTAENRDQVHQFYQKGLECGGQDNGVPGLREHYHRNYYGAFLIDPDGNNIEAVCHRRPS